MSEYQKISKKENDKTIEFNKLMFNNKIFEIFVL